LFGEEGIIAVKPRDERSDSRGSSAWNQIMPLWRRWWFRLILLVITGIGLLAARLYWQTREAAEELRQALAELDEADPDWRLERIEAKRLTLSDKENGAVAVIAAHRALPQNWQNKLWDELRKLPPPIRISSDLAKQLRSELQTLDAALIGARKMIDFPRGRFAINYTPDYLRTLVIEQQNSRVVASLLVMDAYNLIENSQGEQLWPTIHALLNIGHTVRDEPFMISPLIRMALHGFTTQCVERALAHGSGTETHLAAMQHALNQEAEENLFLVGMRGERAGMQQFCEHLAKGSVPITTALESMMMSKDRQIEPGLWDRISDLWALKVVYYSQAWLLRHHTRMVHAVEQTGFAKYEQIEEIASEIHDIGSSDHDLTVAKLLAPSVNKVAQAEQRTRTLLHCAIAGLAAERFRLKHDRWPQSLAELIQAKLLKEAPEDLYDGKPIRFRRAGDGIVFYSVGKDGNAKGDALDRLEDFPPNQMRVEFRLWDPARRRQPPLPPRRQDDDPAP
jgi:hypothetical protein